VLCGKLKCGNENRYANFIYCNFTIGPFDHLYCFGSYLINVFDSSIIFDINSYMSTHRAGSENGAPGSRPSQWRGARRAAVGVKTRQAPSRETTMPLPPAATV
jgi:hypothetical protein